MCVEFVSIREVMVATALHRLFVTDVVHEDTSVGDGHSLVNIRLLVVLRPDHFHLALLFILLTLAAHKAEHNDDKKDDECAERGHKDNEVVTREPLRFDFLDLGRFEGIGFVLIVVGGGETIFDFDFIHFVHSCNAVGQGEIEYERHVKVFFLGAPLYEIDGFVDG